MSVYLYPHVPPVRVPTLPASIGLVQGLYIHCLPDASVLVRIGPS
jgi:hypothetical protein